MATMAVGTAALLFATAVLCVSGCGEDKAPVQQGSSESDTVDTAAPKDTFVSSSCKGVAQDQRRRFAQYDHQCSFLADCPQTGKCSCGAGCGKDKTLCADELCKTADPTCYCGEGCVDDKAKRPLCPKFFCKDKGKDLIAGCDAMQGCVFVDKERDDKCKCTTMPDHEPTCWCGTSCKADKPQCSAALCFGKDPNACIVVPGKKWDNCYCATCGLKGEDPACFFVLCP